MHRQSRVLVLLTMVFSTTALAEMPEAKCERDHDVKACNEALELSATCCDRHYTNEQWAQKQQLWRKIACDGNDGQACALYGYNIDSKNTLVSIPAASLFWRSCRLGDAGGCETLAGYYGDSEKSMRLFGNEPGLAMAILEKGCALKGRTACTDLADYEKAGFKTGAFPTEPGLPPDCTRLAPSNLCTDVATCEAVLTKPYSKHNPLSSYCSLDKQCTEGTGWACYALGRAFEEGRLFARDPAKAHAFLEKGCGDSGLACARLASQTDDYAKRDELLLKACQVNHLKSCQELSVSVSTGLLPPDLDRVALETIRKVVATPPSESDKFDWEWTKKGLDEREALDASVKSCLEKSKKAVPAQCRELAEKYDDDGYPPYILAKGLDLYRAACALGDCKSCVEVGQMAPAAQATEKAIQTCAQQCATKSTDARDACVAAAELSYDLPKPQMAKALGFANRACAAHDCSALVDLYFLGAVPVGASATIVKNSCAGKFEASPSYCMKFKLDDGAGATELRNQIAENSKRCTNADTSGCLALGTAFGQCISSRAARAYEMACTAGENKACAQLSEILQEGAHGVRGDRERAARLREKLKPACDAGDADVCSVLQRYVKKPTPPAPPPGTAPSEAPPSNAEDDEGW